MRTTSPATSGPAPSSPTSSSKRSRALRLGAVAIFFLIAAGTQAQTIYRVGPGGDFATLASAFAAVEAGAGSGGQHEIWIRSGVFTGGIVFNVPAIDLRIIGGYDFAFEGRSINLTATTIESGPTNGTGPEAGLQLVVGEGTLGVRGLRFRGHSPGLLINASGSSSFLVQECLFEALTTDDVAALDIGTQGTASGRVIDSIFRNNRSLAPDFAFEAGLYARVDESSSFELSGSRFENNSAIATNPNGHAHGAAFSVRTRDDAQALIVDNMVRGNRVQAGARNYDAVGLAGYDRSLLLARRNLFFDNGPTALAPGADPTQVYGQVMLIAEDQARVVFTDSVVAGGSSNGLVMTTTDLDSESSLRVHNVTLADNAGGGLTVFNPGSRGDHVASNLLFWNNAAEVTLRDGTIDIDARLSGVDPLFVDPAAADYRVLTGSPAIDAGSAAGLDLGETDLAGEPRIQGAAPDVGAYEGAASCETTEHALCLGDRFLIHVLWEDFSGNSGLGQAVPLTSDTGAFWFFGDDNLELLIKALDGRAINGRFWIFYGALSNVEYRVRVTDTLNGNSREYANPSGTFASVGDTHGLPDDDGAGLLWPSPQAASVERKRVAAPVGLCVGTSRRLCLGDGRFAVDVVWSVPAQPASGEGRAVPLTDDTGAFWFFGATNYELLIKVLDGRGLNGHFWVFYGALSNVEYTLTVTDTQTGEVVEYFNPDGNFGSVGDTTAFPAGP